MVLNPEPVWLFTAKKSLSLWYGHVHLLDDFVVGQWFVLKRNTGKCLWEREFQRANTILEIVDEVILASETRSDGPWTASFGCYGISLLSGEMLWRWYGDGIRGRLAKFFDCVPGFTNELRPHFDGVRGNEFATKQGHILDIRSGCLLRHETETSIPSKNYGLQTKAQRIYNGQQVEIAQGLLLSTREAGIKTEKLPSGMTSMSFPKQTRPFGFKLQNSQGQIVWDWSPTELGLHPITNFYGWRLIEDKLLLICGEEKATIPIQVEKPQFVKPNLTKYHLLCVDALTGRVDQNFIITKEAVDSCRIEDVDSSGFLVNTGKLNLQYFTFAR